MPLIDPQLWNAIKSRRLTFCAFSLLFLVCVSSGFIFFWSTRPISFSSTTWKEHDNLRPRMVDDLLARHNLTGRSQAAIDDLLGVPTGRDTVRGDRYIYWAGSAGIDDMWLEIEFRDGRVSSVRRSSD